MPGFPSYHNVFPLCGLFQQTNGWKCFVIGSVIRTVYNRHGFCTGRDRPVLVVLWRDFKIVFFQMRMMCFWSRGGADANPDMPVLRKPQVIRISPMTAKVLAFYGIS